jgi:hypothetical protein
MKTFLSKLEQCCLWEGANYLTNTPESQVNIERVFHYPATP